MLNFNEAINTLALIEISLKGINYTWSNMQDALLLERLDWVFTSEACTTQYPNNIVLPLAKPIYDRVPCLIQIGTHISRAALFSFENYRMGVEGFKDYVK